ncbi:MAG TPA: serine/threonine-protein kinase [Gaiellaceae bacterium]
MSGYRVDSELGRGGMAVVYAGWQAELDRAVALKVLAAHLAGDEAFRSRFLREARIAARLHHPNLVRVFDIAELDGLPCIVMELLPGGTLEGGRLTREEAAGVADALAHAHATGVVHRDLKPANLLRAADGTVKIADFGIARAAQETRLTQIGTVLGTLRYLSPEQAAGRDVGPPADVYSLAVVLEELLDGRSAELEELLARARDDDPERRPTAAELAAVLHGDTLPAPTRALPPPPASRRPRRAALLLAALALCALAAALAIAFTRGGSDGPPKVEPVPHSASAAQEARNLAAWLRRYSR